MWLTFSSDFDSSWRSAPLQWTSWTRWTAPADENPPWVCSVFRAFLDAVWPPNLEPNVLAILARAINRLKLGRQLFQPRWRRGRWKSLA